MEQKIHVVNGTYELLDSWLIENHVKCLMLVCGKSIKKYGINSYFEDISARLNIKIVRFSNFQSNPLYENVTAGVELYREENCDAIIAVGGGSAIDVAKCIKLYSNLPGDGDNGSWLMTTPNPCLIPFLAMPTTSGTGSEATRFAVIYFNDMKQSISDLSCIPDTVLLDSSNLKDLPLYQKKSTMMDALCHAIESFWSINSTEESMAYSKLAIQEIMENIEGYLSNTDAGNTAMLIAANTAGKAINITQTTAGHAMCYKITSIFGCAHGHAAALCDRVLFPWMIDNADKCIDLRGQNHLRKILDEIAAAMGCEDARTGAEKFNNLFESLDLEVPYATEAEFELLISSVNPVRLKNHPVFLDEKIIASLYHRILNGV